MQFVSAQPLIDQFRKGTFKESEVGSYFLLWAVLGAVALIPSEEPDSRDVVIGIATVVITLLGTLYLKLKNGGTFGNSFLCKYFTLGWVTLVRLFLLAIFFAFILSGVGIIVFDSDTIPDLLYPAFMITFELIYYGWLGRLMAQANRFDPLNTAELIS